ncbi:MAG: T9SS type A sorting domain-containing protein [Ignavibacteria bacterium]|nr:T9SS type A sorting domain-containing protein [Ignavibacteria bacterium]
MRKIILTLSVLCIFSTGFRGGCLFNESLVGNHPFFALVSGLRYLNSDSFVELYYIAAGAEGKIYTTNDPVSGAWTERSSGTTSNINYLKTVGRTDTAVTFGVGDNGAIIRSLNRGFNWTVLNSSVTGNLRSIDFTGSNLNDVIAIGESGLIIKSTDLGETWTPINSGVSKNLNSIYSASFFSILIAGDDGTILRSSDGGMNWENRSLADSVTDLNKIGLMGQWFFGNILGIAGDDGRLYRSTNFLFWDSIYTGINADLFDFSFKNASSGYLCGADGTIIYTTNGGAEWYDDLFLQSITDEDIRATIMINDTVAAGAAGNKIFIAHANEILLPVELTSFTSTVSKNNVTLRWTTGNELNNSGFHIERRHTGEDWINAGFNKGNGTTTELSSYEFTDKNLRSGKYNYRLKQTDFNGNYEYFDLINEINIGSPEKFSLMQNYPNPFNPSTKIAFDLPYESEIRLAVYDMTGKEIAVLINQNLTAGFYEYQWDASGISSGTYFYRLFSNSGGIKNTEVKKMMLIR